MKRLCLWLVIASFFSFSPYFVFSQDAGYDSPDSTEKVGEEEQSSEEGGDKKGKENKPQTKDYNTYKNFFENGVQSPSLMASTTPEVGTPSGNMGNVAQSPLTSPGGGGFQSAAVPQTTSPGSMPSNSSYANNYGSGSSAGNNFSDMGRGQVAAATPSSSSVPSGSTGGYTPSASAGSSAGGVESPAAPAGPSGSTGGYTPPSYAQAPSSSGGYSSPSSSGGGSTYAPSSSSSGGKSYAGVPSSSGSSSSGGSYATPSKPKPVQFPDSPSLSSSSGSSSSSRKSSNEPIVYDITESKNKSRSSSSYDDSSKSSSSNRSSGNKGDSSANPFSSQDDVVSSSENMPRITPSAIGEEPVSVGTGSNAKGGDASLKIPTTAAAKGKGESLVSKVGHWFGELLGGKEENVSESLEWEVPNGQPVVIRNDDDVPFRVSFINAETNPVIISSLRPVKVREGDHKVTDATCEAEVAANSKNGTRVYIDSSGRNVITIRNLGKSAVTISITRGVGKDREGNIKVTVLENPEDPNGSVYLGVSRANSQGASGMDPVFMTLCWAALLVAMLLFFGVYLYHHKKILEKSAEKLGQGAQSLRRTGYKLYAKAFLPPPKRVL